MTEFLVRMKILQDTPENFTENDPVLLSGELGHELYTGKVKIGDGETAWNSLAYSIEEDFTPELKGKLEGIENEATADMTGAEIKAAYEGEDDTNAFTDDFQDKLTNIEDSADVTDSDNVGPALGSINASALADITSPGADIEDAVAKRHATGGDTSLGAQTQDLDMNSHKITGVSSPDNPGDAANKSYVDTMVAAGLHWFDAVLDKDTLTPPASPSEGDRYWIGGTGTDAWAGHDYEIAEWDGAAWEFTTTGEGDVAYVADEDLFYWLKEDGTLGELFLGMGNHGNTHTNGVDDIQDATSEQKGLMTATQAAKLDGIPGDAIADIVDDLTPQLGGTLEINKKSIQYEFGTLPSDLSASGDIVSAAAGDSLAFGDVCYFKSDEKFWKTDADSEDTSDGLMAMALGTIAADGTGLFLLKGLARNDAWAWTAGELFLSPTAGVLTATRPNTTGQIVRLAGYAKSATYIWFDPSKTYLEVA